MSARLISRSAPCPGVSLLSFLRQAHGGPRFLWSSSRDAIGLAGAGIAVELTAWGTRRFKDIARQTRALFAGAQVAPDAHPLAAPRLFGGFAFRDDFVPDQVWGEFSPAHFVLPHFQLAHIGDESILTINAQAPEGESDDTLAGLRRDLDDALHAKIQSLQAGPAAAPAASLGSVDLTYLTRAADWDVAICSATARIRAGELSKVVLSRAAEARFETPVDVDAALAYLTRVYPDTYRFLFEPSAGQAFFGATPELLCAVRGAEIDTMALAGSIRRGASPAEDAELAQALMSSAKDRGEHQIVIDGIRERLQPWSPGRAGAADRVDIGQTGVMTLSNIQHLHTPIHAHVSPKRSVIQVVDRLHPTPALGGQPSAVALPMISALEPVSRGWYGGPIGWIDHALNGAFAVAIRSAVARDERAWLYAGAGIVADSDPKSEWDETGLKFRPMMRALGIDPALTAALDARTEREAA